MPGSFPQIVQSRAYWAQGKYDEAEPLLQRALNISEQSLGPDHPLTATTLEGLGSLYLSQGKYDQAEPLLQRALSISEQTISPDHLLITTSALVGLGGLYLNQGKYEQAEPLLQRAQNILKGQGPDHSNTGIILQQQLVIRLQQINRLKGVARPEIFEEDE